MRDRTSSGKLFTVHLRAILMELWRTPGFLVPTILFPSMLYLFFGGTPDAGEAPFRLAAFAVYGVMGVAFYQFGVGLAEDRDSPWEAFLRILPVRITERFAARIAAALVVSAVTMVVIAATGAAMGVSLTPGQWGRLGLALVMGAVPFGFLGIALGQFVSARTAVPVANLIYLPLAYAGAVWIPPDRLPAGVAAVSPALPSRQFAEVAWAAVADRPVPLESLGGLVVYGLVFAFICVWAYRRNENRSYR